MRSTPLYAPDGMTSAGGASAGFADAGRRYTLANTGRLPGFDGVQAHERHDDGLVHNHAWAASENAEADGATAQREAGDGYFGATPIAVPRGQSSTTEAARTREADHDDGLVHNHEWAVSGK